MPALVLVDSCLFFFSLHIFCQLFVITVVCTKNVFVFGPDVDSQPVLEATSLKEDFKCHQYVPIIAQNAESKNMWTE